MLVFNNISTYGDDLILELLWFIFLLYVLSFENKKKSELDYRIFVVILFKILGCLILDFL